MSETQAVTFTEDRIPFVGMEEAIDELIDLYGGESIERAERTRRFALPLRRGLAAGGGVECTLAWQADDETDATVTLTCDRNVDAPRPLRILLLTCGVIGALLFTIWPFFPHRKEFGALAWMGGAVAIAVYVLTLRKTSGGLAYDFLQRLARRQRALRAPDMGDEG